ncbi:hypothetical protein [Bradyrhizobium sp.]|nr:hypothetical protein [Bradyrhizobium sp.]
MPRPLACPGNEKQQKDGMETKGMSKDGRAKDMSKDGSPKADT